MFEFWKRRRAECAFLLLLFVILVGVFALGNIRRARYLAASYPPLAVFLAASLSVFGSDPTMQRWIRRVIGSVSVLMLPVAALLLAGGALGEWRLPAGGSILVALALAGLWSARTRDEMAAWTWLAGAAVAVFALVGGCIRPVFSPVPLAQAAVALTQAAPDGGTVHTWGLNDSEAAILRMLSGGSLALKTLPDKPAAADLASAPIIITTSPHEQVLEGSGRRMTKIVATDTPFGRSWIGRFAQEEIARANMGTVPHYWVGVRSP